MRTGLHLSFAALLTSAGITFGQAPPPSVPLACPAVDGAAYAGDSGSGDPRVWVRSEYLLWWIKDQPLPVPILTTGSPADAVPGAIGQPGTTVVSPSSINMGTFSGGRASAGGWLDADHTLGGEVTGFLLETRAARYEFSSGPSGAPLLAVPYFSPVTGAQAAAVLSSPTSGATSTVRLTAASQLWGIEANDMLGLVSNDMYSFALLDGCRYLDLTESLTFGAIKETAAIAPLIHGIVVVPGKPATTTVFTDGFSTRNQFCGGTLGARGEVRFFDRFFVNVLGKISLGEMEESVSVTGTSSLTTAGVTKTYTSGFFAAPSNAARFVNDQFAYVPEVQVQLGMDITNNLRSFVGYNYLYVSDVVRPGDQINPIVNTSQLLGGTLVGPNAPLPQYLRTDFWAQGLSVGLELRY